MVLARHLHVTTRGRVLTHKTRLGSSQFSTLSLSLLEIFNETEGTFSPQIILSRRVNVAYFLRAFAVLVTTR